MSLPQFRRVHLAAAFFMGFMMLASAANADDFKTTESATPQEVVNGMSHRLVRGLANTATGWMELPRQIYETGRDDGIAPAIFIGPLKGIGMTVVRTVAGVGEAATFFLPYPGFYDPWIEPHYVWE